MSKYANWQVFDLEYVEGALILLLILLSGHKDPRSLLSYDPDLDPLQKLDMMAAVAQGGAGQRGTTVT